MQGPYATATVALSHEMPPGFMPRAVACDGGIFLGGRRVLPVDPAWQPRCASLSHGALGVLSGLGEPALVPPERCETHAERPSTRDVQAAAGWPWLPHGTLSVSFGSGAPLRAPGVLVGPYHVLTAGHAVVRADAGWATSVIFSRGESPPGAGTARALRLVSLAEWTVHDDLEHDLALVVLERPIGAATGWLGVAAPTEDRLLGLPVTACGRARDGVTTWAADGRVSSAAGGVLVHDARLPGTSRGAALWTTFSDADGTFEAIVGIDAGGGTGVRLTSAFVKLLAQWLETW